MFLSGSSLNPAVALEGLALGHVPAFFRRCGARCNLLPYILMPHDWSDHWPAKNGKNSEIC